MRSSTLIRWLGLAAMLGGALWSIGFVYHASKPRGCVAEECATRPMRDAGALDGILLVPSTALIVAGVFGLVLLVRRYGRIGALGKVGLFLGCAGLAVLVAAVGVQALLFDGDFLYMPYLVVPGLAMLVVGFLFLGIAILRSRVLPAWNAVLLVVAALAMAGANEQTMLALLFVPFGIAWIAVGHALWSAADKAPLDAGAGEGVRSDPLGGRRSPRKPKPHRSLTTPRPAAAAMLVGGALWILYGPLTMLQPWGVDAVYRESRGYSVIVDRSLFLAYSSPGGLALVLTGIGLLGLVAHSGRHWNAKVRAARGLTYIAIGFGVISLVGVAVLFDPVFTAGRIFGTLSLALAVIVASTAARRGEAGSTWVVTLMLVGAIGVLLLPVWPLVYALGWFTEELGALSIALFGTGWIILGWRLWRDAEPAPVVGTAAP